MSTRYLQGEEGWKKAPITTGAQGFCLGEGVLRLPLGPSLGLYPCAHQVTFSEESLPKGHGDFILGYYSHHHSILIGVTEPFQVNRSDSRAKAHQKVPVKCPIFWVLFWDPKTSNPTYRSGSANMEGGSGQTSKWDCRSGRYSLQISLPTSESASSSTDSSGTSSEGEDDSTLELLAPKSRSPSPGKSKRHRSRSPGLARFPSLALRPSSRERRGGSRSPSPQSRQLPRVTPDRGHSSGSRGSSEEGPTGLPGPWAFPPAVPRSLGLLPALRLETVDPGGGGSWRPDPETPDPNSLSPSPQGRLGLEEGGLGP